MPCLSSYEASPPPFLAASLPPPQTQPPPRPENGPRVGGSRRMARCYAPPRDTTFLCSFSAYTTQKSKFPKLIFFDIVIT